MLRMLQRSEDLPLLAESADQSRVRSEHNLDRHQFLKLIVGANRLIDRSHPSAADPFEQTVTVQVRAQKISGELIEGGVVPTAAGAG